MKTLRDLSAPGEGAARARAWRAVSAAAGEAPRRARRPMRPPLAAGAAWSLIVAGLAVLGAALALTSPGNAVAGWVGERVKAVVDPAPERPARTAALGDLPGGGQLLVLAGRPAVRDGVELSGEPWVADGSGVRRLAGAVSDATWSAFGHFAAVTRGSELFVVGLDGRRRWSVAARAAVSNPRWSPDGYRVAYIAGSTVRVVAGDGTGDHPVGAGDAHVAPAWRPGARHVIAFGDSRRITVADADTGERQFVVDGPPEAPAPSFSPDGRRLLLAGIRTMQIRSAKTGRLLTRVRAGEGATFGDAVWARGGKSIVALRHRGNTEEVVVATAASRRELSGGPPDDAARSPATPPLRRIFAARGVSGLVASPDGRWVVVDWRAARSWLFLPLARGRPRQVQNPEKRFGAGEARLVGWCCPA